MTLILDGKKVRDGILQSLIVETAMLLPKPKLAILQVGSRVESNAYIAQKKSFGARAGFLVEHLAFAPEITQSSLVQHIEKLNLDSSVHGIIVQLPLPEHIEVQKVIDTIVHIKDVDGLTSANKELLTMGRLKVLCQQLLGGC